jgi:UrcA family protein
MSKACKRSPKSVNSHQWEKTMKLLNYIIGGALAVALAGPTNAGDLVGPDITVRYGDLTIDTEQDASKLLKRIEGAAYRVCAPLDNGRLGARGNAKACSQAVTAAAVKNVNHPMLLAVYNSAQGVTPPLASLTK